MMKEYLERRNPPVLTIRIDKTVDHSHTSYFPILYGGIAILVVLSWLPRFWKWGIHDLHDDLHDDNQENGKEKRE